MFGRVNEAVMVCAYFYFMNDDSVWRYKTWGERNLALFDTYVEFYDSKLTG